MTVESMSRSRGRILTTHAGSLPRPSALTKLHSLRSRGEPVDSTELQMASMDATRDVVTRQLDAGLDIVNNGEAGRESFVTYVQHRMSGFSGRSDRRAMQDLTRYPGYLDRLDRLRNAEDRVNLLASPQATGDVHYLDLDTIQGECELLTDVLRELDRDPGSAFVSSPSPGIIATAMQNAFYPDMETYIEALGAALAHEYEAIVTAGFTLQIDAPDLALERHTLFQDRPLTDFLDFVGVVIGAINRAIAGLERDRVRLHVCWGNYEGPHDSDVALHEIWSEIARAEVGGFMLAMANPRHAHEYRLFREVGLADDTCLLAGVIDTTTNYVEHPETVADRIERIADAVGDPVNVLASTDCGFETSAGVGAVFDDIVWAKLRSLSAGARLASERLF